MVKSNITNIFALSVIAISIQTAIAEPITYSDGGSHKLINQNINNKGYDYKNVLDISNGTTVSLDDSDVTVSGVYSKGVNTTSGAHTHINNSYLVSQGQGSFSVSSMDGGHTTIKNATITSKDNGYGGLLSNGKDSTINVDLSIVSVTSSGQETVNTAGAIAENNGELSINISDVKTKGNYSSALFAQSTGKIAARLTNLETQGDYSSAIAANTNSNISIVTGSILTNGNESHGAIATSGSSVSLTNAEIKTTGASHGIYSIGPKTKVILDNSQVSTEHQLSSAIAIQDGGNLISNNSNISTQGNGSYGVLARGKNSSAELKNIQISTKGNTHNDVSANAIVSEFGSHIDLNGQNRIQTHGTSAYGILAQLSGNSGDTSVTVQGQSDIITYGEHASALSSCALTGGRDCTTAFNHGIDGTNSVDNALIVGSGINALTEGKGAHGAYVNGKQAKITLDNSVLKTLGIGGHGVAIRGGEGIISHSTIHAGGDDAHGVAFYNGGSLKLSDASVISQRGSALHINGDLSSATADITISNSSIRGKDNAINAKSGKANIALSQSHLSAEDNTLINTDKGDVSVHAEESLLNGKALSLGSGHLNMALTQNSQWENAAGSFISGLSLVNSDLHFSTRDTSNPNGNVTVDGDLYVNNGTLYFNGVLNGDDSAVNKLIVRGNSDGKGWINVTNVGGVGEKTINGIELIKVEGNSSADFQQTGRIISGAYDYHLSRGQGKNQSNWYLTNTLEPGGDAIVRPEGGSYIANITAANTLFNMSLHDRLGETDYINAFTGEKHATSLWLRQVGGHTAAKDSSGQLDIQSNRYLIQLGSDIAHWFGPNQQRYHLGVMGGYGYSHSNTQSTKSGYQAKGSINGYSVGLYGSWFENGKNKPGAYLDSWLQYGWFNNQVKGEQTSPQNYHTHGWSASLESGYTLNLANYHTEYGSVNSWYLQPQAQITWMGIKQGRLQEENGTTINHANTNNIQTRLGIRTFWRGHSIHDQGKDREFEPFVEANWIHNTQRFGVEMNNERIYLGNKDLAEIKLGVEGKINKSINLWANTAVRLGKEQYNDTQGIIGVKYVF